MLGNLKVNPVHQVKHHYSDSSLMQREVSIELAAMSPPRSIRDTIKGKACTAGEESFAPCC